MTTSKAKQGKESDHTTPIRDALATCCKLADGAAQTKANEGELEMRLRQLAAIADLVDAAEVARHQLVTELREPKWKPPHLSYWGYAVNEPASWELIAKAQGMSKQGAQQKFKRSQPKQPAPVDPDQLTID